MWVKASLCPTIGSQSGQSTLQKVKGKQPFLVHMTHSVKLGRNLESFQDYQTKLKKAQQKQATQANRGTFWSVQVHFNSSQSICSNSYKFNIWMLFGPISHQNKCQPLNFKIFQPIVHQTVYCHHMSSSGMFPAKISRAFLYTKSSITQQILIVTAT